MKIINGS